MVDTPGLEPGAARCAGSSPVLGKVLNMVCGFLFGNSAEHGHALGKIIVIKMC